MHQYARIERERRFLLERFPCNANVIRVRRILDRYIAGATLRLRRFSEQDGSVLYKLTQKIPERSGGAQQGWITSMYLSANEYALLAQLPAAVLSKTRHSVPPFGIDVFEGPLHGLVLAEAEFASAEAADALTLPEFVLREVSGDERFTGGRLAVASGQDLRHWLSDYSLAI